MEREAVSCHLDMETSSLSVATAAADCILPTNHEVMASILRRWPLIERHSSTRCQTPISSSSSFSEKSLNSLSLSSTDHTKIMSFFVCPIMFSIPFFWRLERFFFSLADFSETKDLFCSWEMGDLMVLFWKCSQHHRRMFTFTTHLAFWKIPFLFSSKKSSSQKPKGACMRVVTWISRGETIFILGGQSSFPGHTTKMSWSGHFIVEMSWAMILNAKNMWHVPLFQDPSKLLFKKITHSRHFY